MNGGIKLFVTAGELTQEWGRCGLTADWIAGYLVLDLEQSFREVAKNLISTVANELLENAFQATCHSPCEAYTRTSVLAFTRMAC